ncbi:MAG: aminoacyl-histidine dipeptidase [Firmicutes bacterium]|nr:aminoacyl-histidine dipeptidase [Bacillota bacterium]
MQNKILSVVYADEKSKEAVADEVVKGVLLEFQEICSVPHGSGNERELALRFQERFNRMGFKSYIDDINNLICDIPAYPGCESAPMLMLQGHLDMVCAVLAGSNYNPEKDSIKMRIAGEDETGRRLLCSCGDSSLGADCGLGVSVVMWSLFGGDDKDFYHGPIRLLLTAQEEIGLVGANRLDKSVLDNVEYVINVDGFACGRIVAGSAGGMRKTYARKAEFIDISDWILEFERKLQTEILSYEKRIADKRYKGGGAETTAEFEAFMAVRISLSGFQGGHSGYDIDKGRANAIKLMAEFLAELRGSSVDFALSEFNGGLKHNVIPDSAQSTVVIRRSDFKKFRDCAEGFAEMISEKYGKTDENGTFNYDETKIPLKVVSSDISAALIDFTNNVFNGVYKYMKEIPGIVDTSSNLGKIICRADDDSIQIQIFHRSMDSKFCEEVVSQRENCASAAGFKLIDFEEYKAWKFNEDNPLMKTASQAYREVAGLEAEQAVVHVGLEPSVFGEKNPNLFMICMGADIADPHTIHERVYIDSIKPFALTLKRTIQKIAEINKI